MNPTRRSFLLAGLGATQLALLGRFGMRDARAKPTAGGPTKLLTIYVPGGWMPTLLFCPFSKERIDKQIKPLGRSSDGGGFGPIYFDRDGVIVASSGDSSFDPGPACIKQPIRVPKLWDPTDGTRDAPGFNPNGYSWIKNRLWENTCVVHGIDQMTAAHESGQISAMCGAAGSEFRAPSMQAVVANSMYGTYKDTRPLASVQLGEQFPHPGDLPAVASPTSLRGGLGVIGNAVTQRNERAWKNLRDRTATATPGFRGDAPESVELTAVDAYVLEEAARLRGKSSSATDAFLERVYDANKGVSKLLSRDIVSTIEKTPGLANTDRPYTLTQGGGSYVLEHGGTWVPQFDMAMRLLRSNLATSIALTARGPGSYFFDSHGETFFGHAHRLHALNEVLGRFLGEMKATPGTSGSGSLLDETLVVIQSEFARTFSSNDHWPTTSVVFAGGGVTPDTMIGNYDVEGRGELHDPLGLPVDLIEETGATGKRIPTSADICTTVYKIMGVDKFFIPGGYGEIVGVRRS